VDTIWKFPLAIADNNVIEMPLGAEPLYVDVQNGQPYLWARVDALAAKRKYRFLTYGTGHSIDTYNTGKYLGSYQLQGGALVFHVFSWRVE
jgi:hypothetical protein